MDSNDCAAIEAMAYPIRDQRWEAGILSVEIATAALAALRAAGWSVMRPVDACGQKRWIIDVSLRPGMSREEALEWMSKIADLIYETPGEWIATVGMQEHPYTPPAPPEPRDV